MTTNGGFTMCRLAIKLTCLLLLASTGAAADTLLVANKSDDTVDLIDLETGTSVVTLPTGDAPHEIAVSANGTVAVITNYGDRDAPGNSLSVVDVSKGQILRTIELGRHTRPHGAVFVGPHRIAVTTEGSAHLLEVDVESGEILTAVETAQEVSHMVAATPDGTRAFIANIGSGTVTAVDLIKGEKLLDITTGDGAEGIAISPDGREVWVTNRAADSLSVIDSDSLAILATIPCAGFPIRVAFTPEGGRALVSAARSGEVVVFDTSQRRELMRTKLDLSQAPDASRRLFGDRFGESPVPVGLLTSPDGQMAWVAATQADVIVVIDLADLEVRDLLSAGREPDGMAFSPVEIQPSKPASP